jgi:hypothetical protein
MQQVNDLRQNWLISVCHAFSRRLFVPVDISFLAFFRIVYGLTMLWHVWSVISGGRLKPLYIEPVFHFTWYGFEWVRPWPGAGMYIHFVVMLALSVFVTLGFYYRIAAPLLCVCFSYVFLLEQTTCQNHNRPHRFADGDAAGTPGVCHRRHSHAENSIVGCSDVDAVAP